MNRAKDIILVIFIAGIVFFSNLGGAKLWDRDEPRNAGCAKEMIERGNWITPIFNDELRDAKPVLLYWFMIASYQVFGVTEFAARFWSAMAGLGTVLCTYFIAQRFFDRRVGVLSAIVLATSLMFGVAARAATPDSILIFFSTAALALFVASTFPAKRSDLSDAAVDFDKFPKNYFAVLCIYGLTALAVLAKGPIGFLMPTAIIGMYLLIVTLPVKATISESENPGRGQKILRILCHLLRPFHPVHFLKTCWRMRLLTATIVVLLVAGPWYYLVGQQTNGEFLRAFFLKEHWGRSTTSFENHSGSIFYYPMVMAIGFFPWSVFALPVIISIFKSKTVTPKLVFLFCWIGVQTGVFSLVQTKLPSYVTPCYPALAIVTGYFLCKWTRQIDFIGARTPRISFATLALGGVAIMIGIGFAATELLQAHPVIGIVGLLPFSAGLISFWAWRQSSTERARTRVVQVLAGSAVLFAVIFFAGVLTQVSRLQKYDELFVQATQDESGRMLGSFGCLEPTWVFYSGKTVFELAENNGKKHVSMERESDWQPKPRPDLRQFLTFHRGQVITLKRLVPKIEATINRPVSIVRQSPYFMKDEELVLIEVDASSLAANQKSDEPLGIRR